LQLSCLNPFWREVADTREDIAAWIGAFEFPIELPADPLWEIGFRQPSLIVNVINLGDVQTGMRIEFRATGSVTNPSLVNVYTGAFIKLNMTMQAGDVVTVNTGYGMQGVTLNSSGVITNIIRYLDIGSTALQLVTGDNLFRYDAEENLNNLEVAIHHNNLFLGV
jgi:hypothetical protein